MPPPKVLINPDVGSTSGNTRVGWLPRARIPKLPRSCLDPQTVKWTPSSQPWTNWRLMQMKVDFDPPLQSFRNRMVQWCAWTLFASRESQRFNRRFQSCIMGYWGFSLLPSYLRSYLRSYWRRIRSYWSFWMRSSWGSCGPCWLGAFRLWVSFAGIWVFHSMLLWINWRRFEIWSRPPCKKMNKMLEQINNTVRGVYTITLKRSWLDAVSSY